MIDWFLHFAFGIVGVVHHHNVYHDGGSVDRRPSLYQIFTPILEGLTLVALVIYASETNKWYSAGRMLAIMPLILLWPYAIVALVFAIALTIPAYMLYSWYKLIPTREQRTKRAAEKVATLRAQKTEVMS